MRQYRRSHANISLGDYLIAATADVQGLTLASLNVRHFPMFETLEPPFDLE
jgi:predicted nucleic acid-binding protein